jgi:hypothetical protein
MARQPGPGVLTELRIAVAAAATEVSGILVRPDDARLLYVLAHGAGAGMRHPFLEAIAMRLAERGIATLRYQFPYTEQGGRRPDPQPVLLATVRAAIDAAARAEPGLPRVVGGKSMGGRMTTLAAAESPLAVRGIALLGFPLHPAGAAAIARGAHLDRVPHPMLFLQGTRDALATPALIRDVCERLGTRARLEMIDGADHSFHVLKRSGTTDAQVLDRLADTVRDWGASLG